MDRETHKVSVIIILIILLSYIFISFFVDWYERSLSECSVRDKRTLSLELDKQPIPVRRPGARFIHPYTNTKIMVVWLECFEDHLTLPICTHLIT